MKKWVLIGAIGLSVIGALSAIAGGGFQPESLAQHSPQGDDAILEDSAGVWFQLKAAVQEVQRTEPVYRAAQLQVNEATRQIKSFLPAALKASEQVKQKQDELVAIFGMKKAPMKESASSLRFDLITLNSKLPKFETVVPSKPLFKVLRL